MKYFSFLFIFLSFQSFSKATEPFPSLKKDELKEMSFNKLQKLRFAYLEFLMKVERDEKNGLSPALKKKTTFFQNFWKDLLIAHAYAVAPDGSICFFGGWPSKMSAGKCSTPWRTAQDEEVQSLGAYDRNAVCGGATKFRCNPVLFGSPENNGQGLCIDNEGSFNNLTEKCERASRSLVPRVIESYQQDPTAIDQLSGQIQSFCSNYEQYDACDDLARRIREITGQNIGNFSGRGGGGDSPQAPRRAGGTNRSFDSVDGENLGFAQTPESETAEQVLGQCEALLQDRSDVQNRNILSSMETRECEDEALQQRLGSLDDFRSIAENINYAEAVANVNEKAFKQTAMAYIANEIRYGDGVPFTNRDALFNQLVGNLPGLRQDPRYREAFERAYQKLDQEARAGRLYPFELNSTKDQFNNLSQYVNQACVTIGENYRRRFGNPGLLSRWANSDEHDQFFREQVQGVHAELDVLLQQSVVGHLLATSYFKENVFDPSEDFAEECARNPSYQVIKQPIASDTITRGHNEVRRMMRSNLEKMNSRENDLNSGDRRKAQAVLEEFLKTDANIVNLSMEGLNNDEQFDLGVAICNETNNILTSDRRWRMVDWTLAGVGTVAGIVLIATGVGSPIGAALTAASLGVVGYEGARAVQGWSSASARQRSADLALMERRNQMESYLAQSQAARNGKRDALIQGGFAALAGIPPVRVLMTARRPASTAVAVVRSSGRSVTPVRNAAGSVAVRSSDEALEISSRGAQTASRAAQGGLNPAEIYARVRTNFRNLSDLNQRLGSVESFRNEAEVTRRALQRYLAKQNPTGNDQRLIGVFRERLALQIRQADDIVRELGGEEAYQLLKQNPAAAFE